MVQVRHSKLRFLFYSHDGVGLGHTRRNLAVRSALLAAAVESFRPHVLLADKHPVGASGELLPALAALRASGGRAALGLRDILDDPAVVLREWARDDLPRQTAEHYDRVLVYGHPDLFDP